MARRYHRLTALLYIPIGLRFWRQGAPSWAVTADAVAYLAITLLLLPTSMALAEVGRMRVQSLGQLTHVQDSSSRGQSLVIRALPVEVGVQTGACVVDKNSCRPVMPISYPVVFACFTNITQTSTLCRGIDGLESLQHRLQDRMLLCIFNAGPHPARLRQEGGAVPSRIRALLAHRGLRLSADGQLGRGTSAAPGCAQRAAGHLCSSFHAVAHNNWTAEHYAIKRLHNYRGVGALGGGSCAANEGWRSCAQRASAVLVSRFLALLRHCCASLQ